MAGDRDRLLAMGDIMDMQLETSDGRHVGQVADIEAELRDDGALVLTHLVVGPEGSAAVSPHACGPWPIFCCAAASTIVSP